MSRASLWVRFPDGTVRHGLYDGTCDVVWPRLYATSREAWDNYDDAGWDDFTAGDGETVQVAQDYGGGSHWTATATRTHVTSLHSWFEREDVETGGLPGWVRDGQ